MSTWTLDTSHLEVGFSVRHLMVASVKGRFTEVSADIEIDEERPQNSSVSATVQLASLTTGNEERDAHLRSADFFDVERHPVMRFRSTDVRRAGEREFKLAGELTIREVTRPLTLTGSIDGPVTDPWGARRAGFTATGELDREDYGLTWNVGLDGGGVLVGNRVKLALEGELVDRSADSGAAA